MFSFFFFTCWENYRTLQRIGSHRRSAAMALHHWAPGRWFNPRSCGSLPMGVEFKNARAPTFGCTVRNPHVVKMLSESSNSIMMVSELCILGWQLPLVTMLTPQDSCMPLNFQATAKEEVKHWLPHEQVPCFTGSFSNLVFSDENVEAWELAAHGHSYQLSRNFCKTYELELFLRFNECCVKLYEKQVQFAQMT